MEEIGTATVIIKRICTLVDGSCSITFDLNSSDSELAAKLLKRKLQGKDLVTLGIIGVDHG